MIRPKKRTDDDRLAALNDEIARLAAKAKKLEEAKKAKDQRTQLRRALLLGECLLSQETLPASFKGALARMLNGYLKKPADREIMTGWLPETEQTDPVAPTDAETPEPAKPAFQSVAANG